MSTMVLGDDAEVRDPMQGLTVVVPGSRCAHHLSFLPKRPDCPGDIFIKMQVAMLFLKFYWKDTIVAAMQVSFIKVHAAPSISSGIWVLVRCLRAFEDEAVCLHHMASHPVCQLLSFWCCRSCGGPQVVASSLDPHWPWCAIATGAGVLSLWTNALSWLRMCILSVILYRLVDKNDACCQAWIPSEQLRTNMSLPCFWHLWAPWYFIQEQTHPLRLPVLLKGGWSCWELLWSSCQVLFLIQIGPFTEAQNSLRLEAQHGNWGQLSWFWLTSQVYFSVERHCHKYIDSLLSLSHKFWLWGLQLLLGPFKSLWPPKQGFGKDQSGSQQAMIERQAEKPSWRAMLGSTLCQARQVLADTGYLQKNKISDPSLPMYLGVKTKAKLVFLCGTIWKKENIC